MKISFSCVCGKSYSLSAQYAGKKVRCKKCQTTLRVPGQKEEVVDAIIDDEDLVPVAQPIVEKAAGNSSASWQGTAEQPAKPIRYSEKANRLKAEHRRNEQGQGFTAVNPGLLAPSRWKHISNFPHRFVWRLGLLFLFLGFSFVHWAGIPFVLLMVFLLVRYLREVRSNFISGLVSPAKILSTNPPVVAGYSNLSIGKDSCHVIRLFEQPLHKLPSSQSQPRRCATINYFFGMYPGLSEHWFTPLPTMPEFVSDDEVELQRIYSSISQSDWAMLEMGLKQLPPNPEMRTYRVVRPDFSPRVSFQTKPQLALIANGLMKEAGCKVGSEITAESLEDANGVATNPIRPVDVAAVGSNVVVMTQGIFFHGKNFTDFIPWNSIKVAYVSLDELEIVKRDSSRVLIPNDCGIRIAVQLEKLINRAVGVGPTD